MSTSNNPTVKLGRNHYQMMKLFKYGFTVEDLTFFGDSILHIASKNNVLGTVKLLLFFKVNPHMQNLLGKTALHVAIENGNVEIAKYLVRHMSNVHIRDVWGRTPVWVAAEKNDTEMIRYLTKERPRGTQFFKDEVSVVLITLINLNKEATLCLKNIGAFLYDEDVYKLIILCNRDTIIIMKEVWNIRKLITSKGDTLLHVAVRMCNIEVAEELAKDSSLINMRNDYGRTPLHEAIYHGRKSMVSVLLRMGSPKDIDWRGISPIDLAIQRGYLDFRDLFL